MATIDALLGKSVPPRRDLFNDSVAEARFFCPLRRLGIAQPLRLEHDVGDGVNLPDGRNIGTQIRRARMPPCGVCDIKE